MLKSVKVERCKDYDMSVYVISRSTPAPATDKFLFRSVHYMMLVGTHIPDQHQLEMGALVVLLLSNPKVLDVEIWQTNAEVWIADALVETEGGQRNRRGEGETPLEALNRLILNIQRY
jgi:hypothetical protein